MQHHRAGHEQTRSVEITSRQFGHLGSIKPFIALAKEVKLARIGGVMGFAAGIDRAIDTPDRIHGLVRHVIFDRRGTGKVLGMTVQADLQSVALGAAGIAVAGQLMRQIDHEA